MRILENCEPERVFYYFEEIASIPHGSRNTKAISDYLVSFANAHGLSCIQDALHNVIIFKNASAGYENAEPVIIQGHMDMVCEKEADCPIDFEKEGLSLYVDGDFVKARGTTLGGDDGIAVAYALAILEADNIPHPPLEAVITVDEEIGMLGAYEIDLSMLKGRKMLNVDSDLEGHFLTSCAGGMSLNETLPISRQKADGTLCRLCVTGLLGGHSGGEIHKERANANILMGRILDALSKAMDIQLQSLAGGLKDNAIPRECTAEFVICKTEAEHLKNEINQLQTLLSREYEQSDPELSITVEIMEETTIQALTPDSLNKVISYLRLVPNGVQNYSMVIPGLVETSLNLGIMELKEQNLTMTTSIRSSVSTRKTEMKDRVCTLLALLGGSAVTEGDYPAWEYRKDSVVREEIASVYRSLFGKEPVIEAIHAGLECGLFAEKIKDLDCVSFGPDNYDIHTPKERLSISSTERVWKLILAFLERSK